MTLIFTLLFEFKLTVAGNALNSSEWDVTSREVGKVNKILLFLSIVFNGIQECWKIQLSLE
jgi:hypothetical protein